MDAMIEIAAAHFDTVLELVAFVEASPGGFAPWGTYEVALLFNDTFSEIVGAGAAQSTGEFFDDHILFDMDLMLAGDAIDRVVGYHRVQPGRYANEFGGKPHLLVQIDNADANNPRLGSVFVYWHPNAIIPTAAAVLVG